ncbi:MAG: ABC transporter ATP-binding protein [Myxococcales bacterium]|nr:ABC transporter ATP-binding protein [Myxococcales bacterium]
MRIVAAGIEKGWGDRQILRGADLVLEPGECVGLVGANGCGKSTLLAILAGKEEADHGTVTQAGAVGYLGQNPTLPAGTVGAAAREALAWHAELLTRWEEAVNAEDEVGSAALQGRLDLVGWDLSHQVAAVLTRLRAPPQDADVAPLSGGELRRVALARALLSSPELLLLDEPTNHLDAEAVAWLEGFLQTFGGAVVLVTHDRYLLESAATRIVEIEAGQLVSYDGSYADYLIERAERQARLGRMAEERLSMIKREAAWASRSPAAQTKKQKARLTRLDALQAIEGPKRQDVFSLKFVSGARFGKTFLDIRALRKSFGGRRLIWDLDLDLGPGERLGIVGPNGVGKSTLLSMIAGTLAPDAGTIARASRLKIAVLDQARTGLNPTDTVFEAAGSGNDQVVVGDETVHVVGFLRRFLFPREMLEQRVAGLSGGERARLLLAKLMLQGKNLLLLDEPTNDLDLMTLAVLEEALMGFDGASIIVTHDRAFLDRVCTSVLAFHGDGRLVRYASRQQWLAAVVAEEKAAEAEAKAAEARVAAGRSGPSRGPVVRLSFKEQQELTGLPERLDTMETHRLSLQESLADATTWKTGEGAANSRRLAELTDELAAAWARWEALEARR